jgi:uncharacterized membrane protein (UPF0127 family)
MCSKSFHPVNNFGTNYFTKWIPVLMAAGLAIASASGWAQTEAQPPLPITKLMLGTKTVRAETADDDTERSCGLMFRKSLGTDCGMLFVMPQIAPVAFWMRNTEIPLTIAYIDPAGTIMELHDLEPLNETTVRSEFSQIAYALEMPQGWFTKNNIWPGEHVSGLPKIPR